MSFETLATIDSADPVVITTGAASAVAPLPSAKRGYHVATGAGGGVYFKLGLGAVTASSANGFYLPPNSFTEFRIEKNQSHIAAIQSDAAGELRIHGLN